MNNIYTEKAPAAVGPYSQAVVINGLLCMRSAEELKNDSERTGNK